MKLISKFIAAFAWAISVSSFAADLSKKLEVESYDWCNGPVSDPTKPGSCHYQGWNGVDLDSLSKMEIVKSQDIQSYR